ncbi:DUF6134 family protein [Acidocella sp. KAb 2-4]|uniref:DUF6134 family protein n=1 Tax=Acidocella sp. KAb 2-4 TaxID=2885158 RepID=UPI001D068CFA|nr:DUF6134 family protein [Acidocella sp. KAb 2-4]MCB5945324.1 DUF6134 family protein [Acidocella sp. KAb 2-4]
MDRRRFLAAAGASALAFPALAEDLPVPPSGEIAFKVLRNGTPIGEHHINFTRCGDALRAEINADMAVKLAGITVFRYQAQAVECWQGGAFQTLDSQVNHNGTKLEVHAQPITGGYAIQSTKAGDYTYTGQPPMLPMTYWNKAMLNAMILNVETGRHYPAIVNSPGWNYLPTAEGGRLLAQRFDITGKLHLSLWYDQSGQWAGLEFHISGDETFQKYVSS